MMVFRKNTLFPHDYDTRNTRKSHIHGLHARIFLFRNKGVTRKCFFVCVCVCLWKVHRGHLMTMKKNEHKTNARIRKNKVSTDLRQRMFFYGFFDKKKTSSVCIA